MSSRHNTAPAVISALTARVVEAPAGTGAFHYLIDSSMTVAHCLRYFMHTILSSRVLSDFGRSSINFSWLLARCFNSSASSRNRSRSIEGNYRTTCQSGAWQIRTLPNSFRGGRNLAYSAAKADLFTPLKHNSYLGHIEGHHAPLCAALSSLLP